MFFTGMISIILPFGVILALRVADGANGANACVVIGCGIQGRENVQKGDRGSHGVIAGIGNPLKL